MYKCLRALEYIHGTKVMHRDMKPANILISEENEIRICDFGLSRSYETSDSFMPRIPNIGNTFKNFK